MTFGFGAAEDTVFRGEVSPEGESRFDHGRAVKTATPADLQAGAARLPQLLAHRLYSLALAALCLSLSHLFFGRASRCRRRHGAAGSRGG